MNDESYRTVEDLSDEELDELQTHLEELKEDLEVVLRAVRESSEPVNLEQKCCGRLSRIAANQQQQISAAHRRRVEIRLQQVESALAELRGDDYGYCNVCHEPIKVKRLEVSPESPVCVDCQAEIESR